MRVRFWQSLSEPRTSQEMMDTRQLKSQNGNKGQEKEVICHLLETILPHPPKETYLKGGAVRMGPLCRGDCWRRLR